MIKVDPTNFTNEINGNFKLLVSLGSKMLVTINKQMQLKKFILVTTLLACT